MTIINTKFRFLFPLTLASNFIALWVGILLVIGFKLFRVGTVGILFAAILATSFFVQTWLFRYKGYKESQFVDQKWLKNKHKLSSQQFDRYCFFNYAGYSLMKILVVILTFVDRTGALGWGTALACCFGFLILKYIVGSAKIIHLPRGLFKKGTWKEVSSPYTGGIDYANQLASGITTYRHR